MVTRLLSVGPETPTEDEQKIAAGYLSWSMRLTILVPPAVAYFGDLKWVMAIGFSLTLLLLNESAGRLYDLCIRLRRTNLILSKS